MKYLAAICMILFSASISSAWAFQTSSTPAPITVGTPTPRYNSNYDYEITKLKNKPKDEQIKQARENKEMLTKYVDPLYRLPTAKELSSVAIAPEIRSIFDSFLSRPNTGIFRITPDLGCAEVIGMARSEGDCLKYPFPGAGNAYSFRAPGYRMRSLSDLSFSGAKFFTPGALTQGILVKLGDLPIESLDIRSKGVVYLSAYQPASDLKTVSTANKRFELGTEVDGFHYANSAPVEMNMTYALRSIAYKGEVVQSFQGALYNELDYDKRRDVIVLFRTVGFDEAGTLIIIWREIWSSESPKLKTEGRSSR